MSYKVAFVEKCARTKIALEIFHSFVDSFVYYEILFFNKRGWTKNTIVWFFTLVTIRMVFMGVLGIGTMLGTVVCARYYVSGVRYYVSGARYYVSYVSPYETACVVLNDNDERKRIHRCRI